MPTSRTVTRRRHGVAVEVALEADDRSSVSFLLDDSNRYSSNFPSTTPTLNIFMK